jgi:DNA-binding NarL/FixJ family response regulator
MQAAPKRVRIGIFTGSHAFSQSLGASLLEVGAAVVAPSLPQLLELRSAPDALIIDAHHAHGDTLQRVRLRFPEAKIVILNADDPRLRVSECLRIGVFNYKEAWIR